MTFLLHLIIFLTGAAVGVLGCICVVWNVDAAADARGEDDDSEVWK